MERGVSTEERQDRNAEALGLSDEILRNLELAEIPLGNACLKAARLARLLDDSPNVDTLSGIAVEVGNLESHDGTLRSQMEVARDPDVSLSTANTWQYIQAPQGNSVERWGITNTVLNNERRLQAHRAAVYKAVYKYVLNVNYQLRLSEVPEAVFERTRQLVDSRLRDMVPDAVRQFVSVWDSLRSQNVEDWSNAVHSCRRVLQGVADAVYPPNPDGLSEVERNGQKIKVGPDQYVNRIMLYVQDRSDSGRFEEVVGSHLTYLGDRLDALQAAATKGSHAKIQSREEAERYTTYTYMLIGDILSL